MKYSRYLWLLSALLATLAAATLAATIHDTSQQRAAATLIVSATAQQIAERASSRLELLAVQMLPITSPHSLTELAAAQHYAATCHCRPNVSVFTFFTLDALSGKFASLGDSVPVRAITEGMRQLLKTLAGRTEPPVHLLFAPELGEHAIVLVAQFDHEVATGKVIGAVVDARELTGDLFGPEVGFPDSATTLAMIDSLSLRVTGPGGELLFGRIDTTRHLRAILVARAPLEGLKVDVALSGRQIPHPLLVMIPANQLWRSAVPFLLALVVIVFALITSRREAALAAARTDFIAGTSHDLRMPLAQVLLAGETLTLRPAVSDAERSALSATIVRETRRLIGLVENILLFSRAGAVPIRPLLAPVPVDELFGEVAEAVVLAAEDAGHNVAVPIASSLNVLADRHLLRQALVNLVDNALKYGGEHQTIRLDAEVRPGGMVRLYVDDQGPGIPVADRARIFDAYERLQRDQHSERAGSGLGLAVVQRIATACGGKVWIEDAPGGGTRAVLELRAAP